MRLNMSSICEVLGGSPKLGIFLLSCVLGVGWYRLEWKLDTGLGSF